MQSGGTTHTEGMGGATCVCSCISIFGGGVCVWCMWGCRCVRRCVSHIGVYNTLAHQDKGTGGQYLSCGCTCTSVHVGVCGGCECGVHVHCMCEDSI